MKKILLLSTFAFLFSVTLLAQVVPNGGFENWTNGNPDNWVSTNAPPAYSNVTQSSTSHSGNSSLNGQVINFMTALVIPLIQSGADGSGFAISQRFATLTGFYQLTPVSGDVLAVTGGLLIGSTPIASATAELGAASSWTQFNINISYVASGTPDKAVFTFLIANSVSGVPHVGSSFLLDDVNLTGTATSVTDKNIIPAKFSLEQNYPNPFNPSTIIQYNLPENSFVNLKIYNALGIEVASLVNGVMAAGTHEVLFNPSGLNSGVYFYTLKAGNNFVQTRKMILIK